jgi:hypothetical protein
MGTIIALQGIKDSGKSTTIGLLYDQMIKNGGYSIIKKRRQGSHDFVAILEKNGIRIGIITYGDAPSLMRDKINFCIHNGCTIIICACHLNGRTVTVLLEFLDYQPPLYIPKTISNDEDAQDLYGRIERLVGR